MGWKDHWNEVAKTLKDVAQSETARSASAKARETALNLADKAKSGALDAAKSIIDSYDDPAAIKLQFQHARISIISPNHGFEIAHPSEGVIVVSDGENNGLIIQAGTDPAFVADTVGTVTRLTNSTYDLGPKDGYNVVILES